VWGFGGNDNLMAMKRPCKMCGSVQLVETSCILKRISTARAMPCSFAGLGGECETYMVLLRNWELGTCKLVRWGRCGLMSIKHAMWWRSTQPKADVSSLPDKYSNFPLLRYRSVLRSQGIFHVPIRSVVSCSGVDGRSSGRVTRVELTRSDSRMSCGLSLCNARVPLGCLRPSFSTRVRSCIIGGADLVGKGPLGHAG
jgi:hypothetical protein